MVRGVAVCDVHHDANGAAAGKRNVQAEACSRVIFNDGKPPLRLIRPDEARRPQIGPGQDSNRGTD